MNTKQLIQLLNANPNSTGGTGGTGGSGDNPNSYSNAQNTGTSDATRGVMDSFINNTYNPYGNNDDFTQYYAETNGSPAPWTAAGIPESARVGMIQEAMGKDEGWATHVDEENAKRASDMDAMVQHVYGLVQSGDITKAQAGELLGWMDENAWANPDSYGGENYDVIGMYGDMLDKGRQEDANNRGFGVGNAQDDRANFINNSALDLAERILADGSTITADDAYAEIEKVKEENNLSDQELELYYKALNEGLTAGGFGTLDPSKTPSVVPDGDPYKTRIDNENSVIEAADAIINEWDAKFAQEALDKGYAKDSDDYRAYIKKAQDTAFNQGGEYAEAVTEKRNSEKNIHDIGEEQRVDELEELGKEYTEATAHSDDVKSIVDEDITEFRKSNISGFRSMFNAYAKYLRENEPEYYRDVFEPRYGRYSEDGVNYKPPASINVDDKFYSWFNESGAREKYNVPKK